MDSLPQQTGKSTLRMLSTKVGQILRGQFAEAEPLA